MEVQPKSPWESKTLWTNLVLAMIAFVPSVDEIIKGNPQIIVVAFAVINSALRLITKEKISLK